MIFYHQPFLRNSNLTPFQPTYSYSQPYRYPMMQRVDWILSKDEDGDCLDPAQIALVVTQMGFVYQFEKAIAAQSK